MKRILVAILTVCTLYSCTTSKAVYWSGNGWTKGSTKSPMTGWTYTKQSITNK